MGTPSPTLQQAASSPPIQLIKMSIQTAERSSLTTKHNEARLQPFSPTKRDECMKRSFDLLGALVLLIGFSPLLLLIALLQRLTSRETIFFRQERIGKGGKPFHILKFRTLRQEIEENGPHLTNSGDTQYCTFMGAFLRKHHLDELPQLWNVLIGDMSFVGYRPERQHFINIILSRDQRYTWLYTMRPGLTSEATIYNGYTDNIDKMLKRLEMDLDYMPRSSFKTDINIIAKTAMALFR